MLLCYNLQDSAPFQSFKVPFWFLVMSRMVTSAIRSRLD
jgi:hypothetical protein